ncbi:nuclear transport factor 2 family protein [Janthinobacterium sp. 78]|uniref:nuclear transport factor 2 family protein n=1 Tax=Janthinobacterium sp. 78 TaxID=2135631 RepID=UPI000D5E6995|nr:nuclear transport factor 2 family protein [Janthinobacterium sp. 78]PVX36754.1 hypothetical protein C8C92_3373 [Janthinobacterium sp. 78]
MNDTEPLLAWYATLTPDTVGRAGQFYAADAQFRDPFNEVDGVAAIEAILRHMFVHTEQPRFIIGERVRFNADGLVFLHRDYWDAAEELLQNLPLIGAPIRWLRGRFRVPLPDAATKGGKA